MTEVRDERQQLIELALNGTDFFIDSRDQFAQLAATVNQSLSFGLILRAFDAGLRRLLLAAQSVALLLQLTTLLTQFDDRADIRIHTAITAVFSHKVCVVTNKLQVEHDRSPSGTSLVKPDGAGSLSSPRDGRKNRFRGDQPLYRRTGSQFDADGRSREKTDAWALFDQQ